MRSNAALARRMDSPAEDAELRPETELPPTPEEASAEPAAPKPAEEPRMQLPANRPTRLPTAVGELALTRRQIASRREPRPVSPSVLTRLRCIHPQTPDQDVLQAFLALRSLAVQKNAVRNKLIMVTGIDEGAGASYVSMNLAAAFAMDTSRTAVIVEADMAHGSPYEPLLPKNAAGISDLIEDEKLGVADVLHALPVPRLSAVPAGQRRNTPIEVFTEPAAADALQELAERYPDRSVVVDAPPIGSSYDARVLRDLCDVVILVVPHAGATLQQIEDALAQIPAEKHLAVVYNQLPRTGNER